MTITLKHPTAGGAGGTTLALPDQLLWSDEFGWQQVKQTAEYTTTGALIVDAWTKAAGRSITLSGDMDRAWCDRATLLTLRLWASQPGQTFTLTYNGTDYSVIFNHEAGAIEARPVMPWSDPQGADPYSLILRFLQL